MGFFGTLERMGSAFVVRTEHWPFVMSELPSRLDEAGLERFMAIHDGLLARQQPYVTLTDCTAIAEIPNAAVRRRIGEWNKKIEADIRRYNIATAIVISNGLVRGALTALQWLAPPPQPTEVVARPYEGARFLLQQMQRHGMAVTPGLRDYVASLAPEGASAVSQR